MSVKSLLSKQDAGFISLHEVLTRMTKVGDGATYQQAAMALFRLMMAEEKASVPKWFVIDNLNGKRYTNGLHEKLANECLRQAANNGEPSPLDFDDEIPF